MLLFLLFLVLPGCSSLTQQLTSNKFYPKDMKLKVNGHRGQGTLVVPLAGRYDVSIETRGDIDLLWYSNCHRTEFEEKAWSQGWFKSKSKASFSFIPRKLEYSNCPLRIIGMEKIKGRHAWALVDFQDRDHTLDAKVSCNGLKYNSKGVTICQSMAGLYQKIEFSTKAWTAQPAKNECPELFSESKLKYWYKTPLGECTYFFMNKNNEKHRLTTYGWQEPLLKGK